MNVRSLSGNEIYEYLLYALPQTARRNDGRLRDSYLKQYSHATLGGWWCNGLDPLNNWQPMEWGRFKPDQPRISFEKRKSVKYESPAKTPNRVTYFNVPEHLWEKIALRYNIKRYLSPLALRLFDRLHPRLFWEWVQLHAEIPVIICEGEKKASCLLSLGFVAIALPGIWNGRVGKQDFDERLHPDLIPLAQPGRKFIILFDYESNPKSRWQVFQATIRTGKAIEAAGCSCEVAQLPGPAKGVDDFVVERKENALKQLTAIINDAKTLRDYQRSFRLKKRGLNKYKPDVCINVKYLTQAIEKLPSSGLVVIWSDMGTGKTELMRWWREQHPKTRFLNCGHRVNLLKNLANRLQTEMYSALCSGDLAKVEALSITIDSLHKLNTAYLNYGCVFIDEACQYLTHLLHSKTCKSHRAQILEVLEYIVYNAELVVIADAHMEDITIDFFRAMRPKGETPFIYKNEWKNGGRTIYWYEGDNSSAIVADISAALLSGEKIMVVSDSKRFIKKLEQLLTVQVFEDKSSSKETSDNRRRIWSIHSENSGSDENVAFIKDITNAVKSIDALLASPSLATGVDIPDYHFDAVFGVFHGISQTATECAQQLHRYRPIVPFHVWVAPRPPFGYRDTNPTKIKERLLTTNEMTAFLLKIDKSTGKRGVEKDWALDAYCQIMAYRHSSLNNLRTDLHDLLEEMGNCFVSVGAQDDDMAKQRLLDAGVALDAAYYSAVTNANLITATEYRSRKTKDYLKPEEIYECEKFRLFDSYGMEVTPELVEKDDSGRLYSALATLEGILQEPDGTVVDPNTQKQYPAPPTIVAQKDHHDRNNLPLCMDWGNYSARWLAYFNLGLPAILKRLVAGGQVTAKDPDLLRMTAIAIHCAAHVKAILGFTVPSDCKPIWLLGTLLEQLGLKLVSRKVGPRGQQVKYHAIKSEELEFALHVMRYRERKRALKQERVRQEVLDQQRYQAAMQMRYGIEPPEEARVQGAGGRGKELVDINSSSPLHPAPCSDASFPRIHPPHNYIGEPPLVGVDTESKKVEIPNNSWLEKIKGFACLVLEGLEYGIETVKELFSTLTLDERWEVMFEFESANPDEFGQFVSNVPNWVEYLELF